jgi:hypothetical protein
VKHPAQHEEFIISKAATWHDICAKNSPTLTGPHPPLQTKPGINRTARGNCAKWEATAQFLRKNQNHIFTQNTKYQQLIKPKPLHKKNCAQVRKITKPTLPPPPTPTH